MENTQGGSWRSMLSGIFWGSGKKEKDGFERIGSNGASLSCIEREGIFPRIPEEVVSLILSFLKVQEQIGFSGVNRATNAWISSSYHAQIMQKDLRGISKSVDNLALAALKTECMKFKEAYQYSDTLIKYFGGITNILELRVFQIEPDPDSSGYFEELEVFVHSDAFASMPNIFRCRFKSSPHVELIVMKYTLFLPKEMTRTAHDSIWHDYFVLRACPLPVGENHLKNANFQSSGTRTMRGYPRLEDVLNDSVLSYSQKMMVTSSSGISVRNDHESTNHNHEVDKEIEKFRKFINNQFCSLFGLNEDSKLSIHYPFCILASSEDLGNYNLKDFNVYEDLPIKLGHVSIEEMKKSLKQVCAPDFFSDIKGNAVVQNRHKKKRVSSYWKIDSKPS